MDFTFINDLLSSIIYEKKTRTKTGYPEHRDDDCFQYSYFSSVQQRERNSGLSYDPGLPVRRLDDFHCDFISHCKKV